jgi:hypothetical protein
MRLAFSVSNDIESALEPTGIRLRGVVRFKPGEGPVLPDGQAASMVVLLGNIGGSIWKPFSAWRASQPDGGGEHPLDGWSRAMILPVAERFGAAAWFPSDPPYMPFQSWARLAEGLQASPLGILIHPDYGLWHGYRGALGFVEAFDVEDTLARPSPCSECAEKPCLHSCPVGAVKDSGFEVHSCRSHLRSGEVQEGCMAVGCLARNACPAGAEYRYPDEQLRFHMNALSL